MANAPVVIYDTSLNAKADLPLAFDVAYELRANELGHAWFSIPLDDPHVSEVTGLRYAEIYDGDRRIELFRIVKSWKGRNDKGEYYRFECEHALGTLVDDEFDDTFYEGQDGTEDALTDILAEQGVEHWQLDTCEFDEAFLYEWPRGASLLKAILDVPKRFQKGYFFTFDTTSHPWQLSLVEPPTTVAAYIDYARNLESIERTEDLTGLVTKLYPHGAGAGADQIDITSEEPDSHEYITNNTETYGTIIHHWTDRRYSTAAELYAAAVDYLAEISVPKYTYRIKAADLYRITEESIDLFEIGTLVKVTDSRLDFNVDVRVMEIKKSDVTGSPGDAKYMLANKGEEFDLNEYVGVNNLTGIDITDIPGGVFGQLPAPPTVEGLYICTDYFGFSNGTDWTVYLDNASRFWAHHANAHIHFDPAASPPLEIKGSVVITGGSGLGNLSDAGDLAVLSVIGNAYITDLSVDKLTSGTLSGQYILVADGGYLAMNKSSYADTSAGFWLGAGGANALLNIGDATSYLKWTGTGLIIKGDLLGTVGANLDFAGYPLFNVSVLYAGVVGSSYPRLDFTTSSLSGVGGTSYLSLISAGTLTWAGTGTVYGGTGLEIETGAGHVEIKPAGSIHLYAGTAVSFQIGGAQIAILQEIYSTDALSFDLGHEGYMKFTVNGATRYVAFRTT